MPVTGELAFRFASYWTVVAYRRPQRPEIKLPLFHMKSDGFWQPLNEQHNVMKHRDMPAYILFDPEFFAALNDPEFRTKARNIVIRCALTGYRLITLNSGTIVDACHIHQFASSRNNDPTNGIALSKNAHWLFDNGLWSLRDDYTVLVADRHFSETGESAHTLGLMRDKQITLPANIAYRPAQQHLEWHRSHKFLGN